MESSDEGSPRSKAVDPEEGKKKLGKAIISAAERIDDAYERLARLEKQLNLGTTAASSPVSENRVLAEYDALVSEKLAGVFESSILIGGRVELLTDIIGSLASAARAIIVLSAQCKKPHNLDSLSAPLKSLLTELDEMKVQQGRPFSDHVNLIAAASGAFSWVYSSSPKTELKEALKSIDASADKVKKEFTDRVEHLQFVNSFTSFVSGLNSLSRKFPDGLEWNSSGSSAPKSLQFSKRGYVGLDLAPIPAVNRSTSTKCFCEYQVGLSDVIVDSSKNQTVYVLYCRNSSITIKGDPKSIIFDGCTYSTLTVEGSTSQIDVVNSVGIKVKTKGKVDAVNVSRSQGVRLYLGTASADADVVVQTTSKLKLIVAEGDNKVEYEVPTKFKVNAKGGKIETTAV
eukprot:TRINITY_DN7184_c0_g1_i1.p1 TRINITY_DN7184_c0_g1~~TRINITY_DN7184_c0_g1_i1.p1  ORF type:complete len:410 (-),score=83.46 TRINITY_DN7184_c0_g1_i1:67-1266(-)